MLTRTRCLDGCVECEQVRLIGDACDDLDAVADLLRALAKRRDCRIHRLRAGLDLLHVADDLVNGVASILDTLNRIVRDRDHFLSTLRHSRCVL